LITANNSELKAYIEKRKESFHDECKQFTESMLQQIDIYKTSILNTLALYKDTKQKQFETFYNKDAILSDIHSIDKKATNIQLLKEKIKDIKSRLHQSNSREFMKNLSWVVLIFIISLYDYIFLNLIFTGFFDVQGTDPVKLNELAF